MFFKGLLKRMVRGIVAFAIATSLVLTTTVPPVMAKQILGIGEVRPLKTEEEEYLQWYRDRNTLDYERELTPIEREFGKEPSAHSEEIQPDSENRVITLTGGPGDDYLTESWFEWARHFIDGRGGNDHISGGWWSDTLIGGTGDDYIHGGTGSDIIGRDGPSADNSGNDEIWGYDDDDEIVTGDGSDTVMGESGNDYIRDVMSWNEVLRWRQVEQNIREGRIIGDDAINDAIAPFTNYLEGSDGDDTIIGGQGPDIISGGYGYDRMQGGEGNDYIYSGKMNRPKIMRGGPGNDSFILAEDNNVIEDNTAGRDLDITGRILDRTTNVIRISLRIGRRVAGLNPKIAVFRVAFDSVRTALDLISRRGGSVETPDPLNIVIVEDFTAEDIFSMASNFFLLQPVMFLIHDGQSYMGTLIMDIHRNSWQIVAMLASEDPRKMPTSVAHFAVQSEWVGGEFNHEVAYSEQYVEQILNNQRSIKGMNEPELASSGDDIVIAAALNDFDYNELADLMLLKEGDDRAYQMRFYKGDNTFYGGPGNDTFWVASANNVIAEEGDNVVYLVPGYGHNSIQGGEGSDQFWVLSDTTTVRDVHPEWAANVIHGFDPASDVIGFGNIDLGENFPDDITDLYTPGNRVLLMDADSDVHITVDGISVAILKDVSRNDLEIGNFVFLNNDTSGSTVMGTEYEDSIFINDKNGQNVITGSGNDAVFVGGNSENNSVHTGSGYDLINVEGHNNIFFAGDGEDVLMVNSGDGNILYGGLRADQFWISLNKDDRPANPNIIGDFAIYEDVIGFSNVGLSEFDDPSDDLELEARDNDVVIRFQQQELAILRDVSLEQLTSENFILMETEE